MEQEDIDFSEYVKIALEPYSNYKTTLDREGRNSSSGTYLYSHVAESSDMALAVSTYVMTFRNGVVCIKVQVWTCDPGEGVESPLDGFDIGTYILKDQDEKELSFYIIAKWTQEVDKLVRNAVATDDSKLINVLIPLAEKVFYTDRRTPRQESAEGSTYKVRMAYYTYGPEPTWTFRAQNGEYEISMYDTKLPFRFYKDPQLTVLGYAYRSLDHHGNSPNGPGEVMKIYRTVMSTLAEYTARENPRVFILDNADDRRAGIVAKFLGLFPEKYKVNRHGNYFMLTDSTIPDMRELSRSFEKYVYNLSQNPQGSNFGQKRI